jgi:nitrogen regulatory protein PII
MPYEASEEYVYSGDHREDSQRKDLLREAQIKSGKKKHRKKKSIPVAGANGHAPNMEAVLAELLKTPKAKRTDTMLDDVIFQESLANTDVQKIGRMVGLTVAEVQVRYKRMLAERMDFTPAEMQMHLVAQLQAAINGIQEAAQNGSTDHAKIWIQAIELLAKLHGLLSEKAELRIEIVTNEQTNIFITALAYIVEKISNSPIAKQVDPLELNNVMADGLKEASAFIHESQNRKLSGDGQIIVDALS